MYIYECADCPFLTLVPDRWGDIRYAHCADPAHMKFLQGDNHGLPVDIGLIDSCDLDTLKLD